MGPLNDKCFIKQGVGVCCHSKCLRVALTVLIVLRQSKANKCNYSSCKCHFYSTAVQAFFVKQHDTIVAILDNKMNQNKEY